MRRNCLTVDADATGGFVCTDGGTKAYTGPTLSGCTYADKKLTIEFNVSLLRGDSLVIGKIPAVGPGNTWQPPKELADSARLGSGSGKGEMASEGSQLYVQTDAKMFCIEKRPAVNATGGPLGFAYCPKWAGGDGTQTPPPAPDPEAPPPPTLDGGWVLVNYTKASDSSIVVDLAPLNGSAPTAVQYAWGVADCCDHSDANLYITHGCGLCPIMSSSNLPANPFKAKVSNNPIPDLSLCGLCVSLTVDAGRRLLVANASASRRRCASELGRIQSVQCIHDSESKRITAPT